MADQANRARLTSNPYSAIYGSPDQQSKVAALFPQGAGDFSRISSLEGNMADTSREVLGGSQTQPRAMADQAFDSAGPGVAMNIADAAAAGASSNPLGVIKSVGGMFGKLGSAGESRAAAMAPNLFDTDPNNGLKYLDGLMARNSFYGGLGSHLFSGPSAAGAVGAFNSLLSQ